jgi:hypothetical protein
MEQIMTGWRLILKGQQILKMGKGAENAHQLSLRSGVSYPTVKRYVDTPELVQALDAIVLPTVLIEGQGLTREQVLDLRIGDLFDILQDAAG